MLRSPDQLGLETTFFGLGLSLGLIVVGLDLGLGLIWGAGLEVSYHGG